MFYCEKCRAARNWPVAIALSAGRCELCGEIRECYDGGPAEQLGAATEGVMAQGVIAELRAYYRRWESGAENKDFPHGIEPVYAGHALHTAVMALEALQPERGKRNLKPLPHPAVDCWRSFLIACRSHRFAAIWWADAMEAAIKRIWFDGSPKECGDAMNEARLRDEKDCMEELAADVAAIRAHFSPRPERKPR